MKSLTIFFGRLLVDNEHIDKTTLNMVQTRNHDRAAKRFASGKITDYFVSKAISKPPSKKIKRSKRKRVMRSNRPTYKTMVIQSVKSLARNNGSSDFAIKKYIAFRYKCVDLNSLYIKKALSDLKLKGILVSSKAHPKSFKLVKKALNKTKEKHPMSRQLTESQHSVVRSVAPTSISNLGSCIGGSSITPTNIVSQPSIDSSCNEIDVLTCADINQSQYDVSVVEPYSIHLNLTDHSQNMDKFYKMQVVKSEDSAMFWFVQNWGRNGTEGQSQTNGPFCSKTEATNLMEAKFKTKTGVMWAERTAAFNSSASTGKYEIQERLALAGAGKSMKAGSIAISLMWDHSDANKRNDLDLWVVSPTGERIGYNHKQSACGGELDVDRRQDALRPVENIIWKNQMPKGKFQIWVHNFSANHTTEIPFHVSTVIDGGDMEMLTRNMPGENKKWIHVKTINYE